VSAEKLSVVVSDKMAESGLAPLIADDRFSVELAAGWKKDDPDRFREVLSRASGLIVRSSTQVDRDLLELAPKLQVVGRAGVGVDNIDIGAATERGVAVLNAPSGNTVSAAELTMALILAVARRIAGADRSVRAGHWDRSSFAGVELRGKTLGLVGAGRIGSEVARRAKAFGMTVLVHDPYLTEARADELGARLVDLPGVLAESDFLSLHVPLTDQTRGLLGKEQLAALKPGSFLVNVARGGVVDEDELADAVETGHLAGAAVDVYSEEPLSQDSRLRKLEKVVLTPHLGASTAEAQELVALEIADAVRSALLEGDLSRALNAPAISGDALRKLRPVFELGRRLGRLGCALTPGGLESVEVNYAGAGSDSLRPLASYVLMGLLQSIVGGVNFVNASHLAEARGIDVSTKTLARRSDYSEFVEVITRAGDTTVRLAGVLLGDQHPRIVRIDDYHVDVTPRGTLLVLRNRDVPGVIGKVGSLLGSMMLNIAEYHQARLSEGGEALAAVAIDGRVDSTLIGSLMDLPEITGAWVVDLA
jgi:D-3-phosphoglycerate dehydrogenase